MFYSPDGNRVVKRCRETKDGQFFAQGDNTHDSFDSRNYGLIPINHIVGKVIGIK